MKFSSKEDIEAPIDTVFELLSEFDVFERAAMRRGAEIVRTDKIRKPAAGMSWDVAFALRGKRRNVAVRLVDYSAPRRMEAAASSPGFEGQFCVDLIALSKKRTRIAIEFDIKPQSLSARLMIQSMRLAKSSLNRRFKMRVAEFAKDLEERAQRA